jgi:hypothetical protein
VAKQEAGQRRRSVRAGTLWFSGLCLATSLCLVALDGVGTGVGASGASRTKAAHLTAHLVVHDKNATASRSRQLSSRYWGTDDVPPPPKPVTWGSPTPAVPAPPPAPVVSAAAVTPPPSPPPTPAPPLPAPQSTALPGRGAATASGCAAALAYLVAYSAPGFTFECPGSALGHQAMTCIDEPGVCGNERLIAIADPCPAAYMNEASNSWVLTGASDAPIDPYGACQ